MVVRGEGDVGRVAPAAFVPSRARSYPPRSLVPPRSFVPPALPSYLLALVHTVPAARLYTFGPAAAVVVAADAARTPSLAPWFVCARPVLVLLSVVPYL